MEIEIISPDMGGEPLDDMLRDITRAIVEKDDKKWVGGFIGGTYGYGAEWSSDVFDMRPFYWGDCDCGWAQVEEAWPNAHRHADDCYQSELRRRQIAAGGEPSDFSSYIAPPSHVSYTDWRAVEDAIYVAMCEEYGLPRFGCATHCTCSHEAEWKAFYDANGGHKQTCSLELPNFRHHASGLAVRWYKYIGRGMEASNVPADLTPIFRECLAAIATEAGTAETGTGSVHEGAAPQGIAQGGSA